MSAWPNHRYLIVASPFLSDSVSWWRAWGPLCALRETMDKLALIPVDFMSQDRVDWPQVELCSGAWFNRPFKGGHAAFMEYLATSGKPCVIDYDDCLWELPVRNHVAKFYGEQEKNYARDACAKAWTITTSTPALAEYISERIAPDAAVQVIPNSLPDWYQWNETAREKIIIYRGGKNRHGDLYEVADDLATALRDFPDWRFVSVGEYPWFLEKRMPFEHHESMHLPTFHNWLRFSTATIMVSPLEDSLFNRCKSDISWMEGTIAGAAVLGPDFPEFQRPGCTNYKPGEFGARLREMMAADMSSNVAASRTWIDGNRRLSVANQARARILDGMFD